MQELVELLSKSLVDNPEAVQINMQEDDNNVLIEVRVASEDMGKIIGKQGKIARAIRTLAKARGAKTGKRISVEILS
ncbi:MAG: KH domain-containing protein [Thermacetogeniaceae bacterium]